MKDEPMFVNGKSLLKAAPIFDMFESKCRFEGTSFGLSEAGYDIRIKQNIHFVNDAYGARTVVTDPETGEEATYMGHFVLASSMERFQTPHNLVGTVKDKSTWARQGLSVFNTVIEPGWNGFLTLELVYHGFHNLKITSGQGIAQVLYGLLQNEGDYGDGKYQNQESGPVTARA
jgi:dCTP deaminase